MDIHIKQDNKAKLILNNKNECGIVENEMLVTNTLIFYFI